MPESRIPANAPKPQDRKPKKATQARKAEAEATAEGKEFVLVEQCGVLLKIPIAGKTPLEAAIAFAAGDDFNGTRHLLGEDQWEKFIAAKPTVDDYNELGTKLEAAAGN